MRRVVVVYFIILTLVAGCLPESKSVASEHVKVVIADRVFKVPKGYFDGSNPSGKDTESVVLEYSLPGFEVLPPHPQARAERQKLINEGRMRGMLLEAERNRPSFDIAVKNHMSGVNRDFRRDNSVYGLEKHVHMVPPANFPAMSMSLMLKTIF